MADISTIYKSDRHGIEAVKTLLETEGIHLDAHLDYLCGIYEDGELIACGGAYRNSLRCFAVDRRHQGEGLLNTILSHLMERAVARGAANVFLCTKTSTSRFFGDLGFYEIARAEDLAVFMESDPTGFADCLVRFARETADFLGAARCESAPACAIVMNANPFTCGHLALIERAASENALVHLFLVSEDASLFPFVVRKTLVEEGIAHLKNVVLHESGPYIISSATFPSYFQKDEIAVSKSHAAIDLAVFVRIAKALSITRRYVGEEPTSGVTALYNDTMRRELARHGIACHIIPRVESTGHAISASEVRARLKEGDFSSLASLVPPSTLRYLTSDEAAPVLEAIRQASEVRHH